MQHSESVKEIFGAFSKFRAQVKQPAKTAKNPYFNSKYVTLEGVMQAVDAALPGTGLAYSQLAENGDNGVSVSTLITHSSGEWMIVGPLTLTPTKRDPQGQGSAITYAKRYQLASAFGISSDIDDDGNAGTFGQGFDAMDNRQSGYKSSNQQPSNGYQRRQTPQQKQLHDQASAVMDEVADIKHKAEVTIVDSSGTSLLDLCKQSKQEGGKGPAHQRIEAWIAEKPELSTSKHNFIKRIGELNIV